MALRKYKFGITTAADGTATVTGPSVLGELYAVQVLIGTLTNGAADITLATVNSDAAATLLTLTNITANALYYPRHLVHGETGTALTGTAGGDRCEPLLCGNIRVTVAGGGNATSGAVIVFWEE